MSFFKFSISDIEGIETDIETETAEINKRSEKALDFVGSEMIVNLQKHIHDDWYVMDKPYWYKRRTDNNSLGTPLGSDKNFTVSRNGLQLSFRYNPTGEHKNEMWNNKHKGDSLIWWVQEVKGNPFWDNFVDEQKNGGIISNFARAMSPTYLVTSENGNDVEFSNGESEV